MKAALVLFAFLAVCAPAIAAPVEHPVTSYHIAFDFTVRGTPAQPEAGP